MAPPVPLSSDALAGFSRDDKECNIRDKEIHDATEILVSKLIPAVADDLMSRGHPLQVCLSLFF